MPQLPSGKHLALSPQPLRAWMAQLLAQGADANWPSVPADLSPVIEILWLEPAETSGVQYAAMSNRPPTAMRSVPSGFRLKQLPEFLRTLDVADAEALRQYVTSDVVRAQLEAWLSSFTAERRRLRHGAYGWDLYDLFAALLRLDRARTRGLVPKKLEAPLLDDLHGMLGAVREAVPALGLAEADAGSTGELAATLRAQEYFAAEDGRDEFTHMLLGVCWRMTGELELEELRAADAEAIDIITLAGLGYDPQGRTHRTFRDGVARELG